MPAPHWYLSPIKKRGDFVALMYEVQDQGYRMILARNMAQILSVWKIVALSTEKKIETLQSFNLHIGDPSPEVLQELDEVLFEQYQRRTLNFLVQYMSTNGLDDRFAFCEDKDYIGPEDFGPQSERYKALKKMGYMTTAHEECKHCRSGLLWTNANGPEEQKQMWERFFNSPLGIDAMSQHIASQTEGLDTDTTPKRLLLRVFENNINPKRVLVRCRHKGLKFINIDELEIDEDHIGNILFFANIREISTGKEIPDILIESDHEKALAMEARKQSNRQKIQEMQKKRWQLFANPLKT